MLAQFLESPVNGTIESIAFGGSGILRHDGLVVFVPFTAPEDEVLVEITHQKKSHAQAKLIKLKHAGPDRVTPRCPHFGICGGCQLQHLQYDAQLLAKQKFVEDALLRVGKLSHIPPIKIVGADTRFGYRRHVRFKLWPSDNGYRVGFVGADPSIFVPIASCHIFLDDDAPAILGELQEVAAKLQTKPDDVAHVMMLKDGPRFVMLFDFSQPISEKNLSLLEASQAQWPTWKGVVVRDRINEHVFGDTQVSLNIDGLQFVCDPRAFVQNHPEQSARLYCDLLARIALVQPKTALDLYCGLGVTSILMARQGISVTGVEVSDRAIALAKQNAAANQARHVSFMAEKAEDVVALLLKNNPDVLLINPPRAGMHPHLLATLKTRLPKHIFYVSCMPATLARDIGQLAQVGYSLKHCQAYDMFPQTSHVEVLAELAR